MIVKNRDQICPVVLSVGHYWDGGDLVIRQPDRQVRLRINQALWNAVCKVSDGRNTMEQMVAALVDERLPEAEQPAVERLVADLWRGGILVDAADMLLHYSSTAEHMHGWGLSIPRPQWESLAACLPMDAEVSDAHWLPAATEDAAGWGDLVVHRGSTIEWRQAPISSDVLQSILRCYAAIPGRRSAGRRRAEPLRAVASAGGLYRLKVFLILLAEIDGMGSGVYEVVYGRDGEIGTRRLPGDAELAYRGCLHPELLTNAAGWLVLAADISTVAKKYRNRAYANVHIEAGLALQNFSLLCGEAGLGQCIVTGYDDAYLRAICHCEGLSIVGSAIFGVPSTAEKDERPAMSWDDASIEWSQEFPELPYHLAVAHLERGEKEPLVCVGRDEQPRLAFDKALSELIERCGLVAHAPAITARYDELASAIHPGSVLEFSPAAYQSDGFPFARFDRDRAYEWVEMRSYLEGKPVWMLKDFCFSSSKQPGIPRCASATSSGMACAPNEELALRNAVLELIERDAFMRVWISQMPPPLLPGYVVADDVQDLVRILNRHQCTVEFRQLPSALAPVCLVVVRSTVFPWVIVSANAATSWVDAVRHAMREVATVAFTKTNSRTMESIAPEQVRSPGDHQQLFCQERHIDKLNFLSRNDEVADIELDAVAPLDLGALVERIEDAGFTVYWHRVPTPHAPRYLNGGEPIVVRAIAPGLVPITFGWNCTPWLGEDVNHPDSAFPHPFP